MTTTQPYVIEPSMAHLIASACALALVTMRSVDPDTLDAKERSTIAAALVTGAGLCQEDVEDEDTFNTAMSRLALQFADIGKLATLIALDTLDKSEDA